MRLGVISSEEKCLIAVMGRTGTGKSSFIKLLTRDPNIRIGHGQESETHDIVRSTLTMPNGRSVTFFDTPGFDDSRDDMNDAEILNLIAKFLSKEYEEGRKLNGVIYMHRITEVRMGATSQRSLRLFRGLCGDDAMNNVIIVTTMWDSVNLSIGEGRESGWRSDYARPLLDAGAQMMRHDRSRGVASAQDILNVILGNNRLPLLIQEQIRDGTAVINTDAGQVLDQKLQERARRNEEQLDEIRRDLQNAGSQMRRELNEERRALQAKMGECSKEKEALEHGLATMREQVQRERRNIPRVNRTRGRFPSHYGPPARQSFHYGPARPTYQPTYQYRRVQPQYQRNVSYDSDSDDDMIAAGLGLAALALI